MHEQDNKALLSVQCGFRLSCKSKLDQLQESIDLLSQLLSQVRLSYFYLKSTIFNPVYHVPQNHAHTPV